jgi:hypothetical protein
MSRLRSGAAQSKGLAVVPGSGNGKPTARDVQPAFDTTIASASDLGIGPEDFIKMTRFAKASDPRVTRFLDAWDALDASEQQARGAADAVCERVGLASLDLLKVVADGTCRFATTAAQIMVGLSYPDVVTKTIELALNAEDDSDQLAAQTILHKAMGFLPMPKGSQTIITAVMQNAQATAAAQPVAVPRLEETIRLLSGRFNAMRGLPRPPAASDSEPMPVEVSEGKEDDAK